MTINERIEAGRRERRVLTRVCRAGWRLEQAERERTWALASARAEGISIRTLATAIGLSPSRVHQIVAAADLDALDAALGELRAARWPAPEDPDAGEDADWPDQVVVAVDLAWVQAIIDRIAADVDELARARRVQDLDTAAVLADPGPGVPGLLRPSAAARFLNPGAGTGLGRLAGRAVPARRN